MKNFTKILCVALALVMALSVASCSLSKQYAYQKDGVELPIGVYVYYLYSSYNEAQALAQQSDLYDSATGKYDGKKSFLKIEITDEDGNTAVAENWIVDKAKEKLQNAVAIETKYKELGCTVDEAELDQAKTYIQQAYWDKSLKSVLEPCGVSFDSFFMAEYTINIAEKNAAFKAEYGEGGPSAVSTADMTDYFTKNYTSYKHFSANLYTSADNGQTDTTTATTTSNNTPLSEEEIAKYTSAFDGYATDISNGGKFEDASKKYMEDFNVTEDPTTANVEIIDENTTDELLKTIKEMKDGQAMTVTIGDDDTTKQLYLVYREPIENQIDAYINNADQSATVLQSMKGEDFDALLKKLAEDLKVEPSSACNNYKPSIFETKKK
ncbi:hypothetical protein [Ruminococcus sp.]|uniref:hypothetical protein n=1 Tax=Ruminococcus sp. TaxID=41978 RepID=UPI00386661CE